MAYMVAYKKRLIKQAYVLLKEKSNEDDIKAAEDLAVLDTILAGIPTSFNRYSLDERLRKEYKTIGMLENIQMKFSYNDGKLVKEISSEQERIMNRLESDKMGVIADVLLKHGKIKCVDEIYKRVCDDNTSYGIMN